MPWGRLDDRANGNAKLLALSDAAWRMWGCGLIYCQANLTDGFIPDHAILTFGVRAKNKSAVVAELCSVLIPSKSSLWERVPGGYQVHDYFDWNVSRDEVLTVRQHSKQRFERWKERARNALQTRLQQASTTTTTTRKEQDPRVRARVRGPKLRHDWREECARLHEGRCGNATFHEAKMAETTEKG